MKKRSILLLFCNLASITSSKHIIFDLGGILLSRSKYKVVRSIGLYPFCSYFFTQRGYPQTIFNISMNVLEHLEPPIEKENEPYAYLHYKKIRKLPTITTQWLAGLVTSEEVKQRSAKMIEQLKKEDFFSSEVEKDLVQSAIESMFDPYLIAQSTKKIRRGISLVRELFSKGHTLYILSNWDSESFCLIYQNPKFHELFRHFKKEHVLISGEINEYKPHPAAFEHLMKQFNLDPSDCFFIDDQEENIETARKLGIAAFHVPQKRFKNLRTTFKNIGIL